VKHAVRRTLATLLLGVVGQRVLQLVSFLCIGRALGAEQLGLYAQGVAVGAMLGVLAGAGVRKMVARAVAESPGAVGGLLLTAVRLRLTSGLLLLSPAVAAAFLWTDSPWFWTLSLLQVLPGAFDLKNLSDVAGRTRGEVALETGTVSLQLIAVLVWLQSGGKDLAGLAAIALASRCVYAAIALPAIARLPRAAGPAALPRLRAGVPFAFAEGLHSVLTAADIWFVALCFGDAASGFYAVATRFAGAALLPSTQLARLLLPHLLHSGAGGDPVQTLRKATRATLLVTLPMLTAGAAVAPRLCALPGPEFERAAPALVLALLSGCLQHSGWQCSNALLAKRRDAAYARTFAWPSALHAVLLTVFGLAMAASPFAGLAHLSAMDAAGAAVLANGAYYLAGARSVRDLRAAGATTPIGGPLAVAIAAGLAAAVPAWLPLRGPVVLPLQLTAGGLAFLFGVWAVELRGRLRRFGDGLASASGFRT
jgi:O-antigen/teichoic acid export membrane protein